MTMASMSVIELLVPVFPSLAFAPAHQPIEIAVRPRNEPVETDAHKDFTLRHSMTFSFHNLNLQPSYRHTSLASSPKQYARRNHNTGAQNEQSDGQAIKGCAQQARVTGVVIVNTAGCDK